MNNYIVVGYCLTYIPFYKQLLAQDEKIAFREVKEYMENKGGLSPDRVVIDKVIELPVDELPNVN